MLLDTDLDTGLSILYAFKEWAVVVDALGTGRQTILLRKGGIEEASGGFRAEHKEFFLYPTYEHESEENLVPQARGRLRNILRDVPEGKTRETVPIQFYAILENDLTVSSLEALKKLARHHVWSARAVEKRFLWGREHGLHLLVARIFRLPEPYALKVKPSYRGCKSWVSLEEEIPTGGAHPVLRDEVFLRTCLSIKRFFPAARKAVS